MKKGNFKTKSFSSKSRKEVKFSYPCVTANSRMGQIIKNHSEKHGDSHLYTPEIVLNGSHCD